MNQSATVTAQNTLIDPDQAGSVTKLDRIAIRNRISSVPGRSLQDFVNSQPGWLYEGNAVLHPRGSEYQTQFVVDGIPLTDNRSPASGLKLKPRCGVNEHLYCRNYQRVRAENGRRSGGEYVRTILKTETPRRSRFVRRQFRFCRRSVAQGHYVRKKATLGASANGTVTDHYLNPVVAQNYLNAGPLGDLSDIKPTDQCGERPDAA